MKTIIVATDFSVTADNAVYYAVDMAQGIKADILLLHIYKLPVTYGDVAAPVTLPDWEEETDRLLTNLKQQIKQRSHDLVQVNTEVRVGSFLTELNTVCERVRPYAVIVGSQGTTATERFLFGSHAITAMKDLEWPVIAVPRGAIFHAVKKIALACDLEHIETSVPLEEINVFVTDFKAELHVLNVHKSHYYDPEGVFAAGWLEGKLKSIRAAFHFLSGDIYEAVLDFVAKNEIDLLIVLPKKHSFLEALIHKGHTKQFTLHSPVPLMALHIHQETVTQSSSATSPGKPASA